MRERIRKMSKRSSLGLILFGLLTVMILSAGVQRAWSYFTTFATAAGGYEIHLDHSTNITEEIDSAGKHIGIMNEGSQPVYVRARAFCSVDSINLAYEDDPKDEKPDPNIKQYWIKGKGKDEFYYYQIPLEAGETTLPRLLVSYNLDNAGPDVEEVKIVVVYESTPVTYTDGVPDANNSDYPGWTNQNLDITDK